MMRAFTGLLHLFVRLCRAWIRGCEYSVVSVDRGLAGGARTVPGPARCQDCWQAQDSLLYARGSEAYEASSTTVCATRSSGHTASLNVRSVFHGECQGSPLCWAATPWPHTTLPLFWLSHIKMPLSIW